MKTWQKLVLVTLLMVVILGARVYFVWKERQDPGVIGRQAEAGPRPTQDELAYVKLMLINSFTMAKQLEGTTVWIKLDIRCPIIRMLAGG